MPVFLYCEWALADSQHADAGLRLIKQQQESMSQNE
jgi:hypothetical protein